MVSGVWGDHFRAGHPAEAVDPPMHNNDALVQEDALVAAEVYDGDLCGECNEDDEVSDGAFARLRMAGLL